MRSASSVDVPLALAEAPSLPPVAQRVLLRDPPLAHVLLSSRSSLPPAVCAAVLADLERRGPAAFDARFVELFAARVEVPSHVERLLRLPQLPADAVAAVLGRCRLSAGIVDEFVAALGASRTPPAPAVRFGPPQPKRVSPDLSEPDGCRVARLLLDYCALDLRRRVLAARALPVRERAEQIVLALSDEDVFASVGCQQLTLQHRGNVDEVVVASGRPVFPRRRWEPTGVLSDRELFAELADLADQAASSAATGSELAALDATRQSLVLRPQLAAAALEHPVLWVTVTAVPLTDDATTRVLARCEEVFAAADRHEQSPQPAGNPGGGLFPQAVTALALLLERPETGAAQRRRALSLLREHAGETFTSSLRLGAVGVVEPGTTLTAASPSELRAVLAATWQPAKVPSWELLSVELCLGLASVLSPQTEGGAELAVALAQRLEALRGSRTDALITAAFARLRSRFCGSAEQLERAAPGCAADVRAVAARAERTVWSRTRVPEREPARRHRPARLPRRTAATVARRRLPVGCAKPRFADQTARYLAQRFGSRASVWELAFALGNELQALSVGEFADTILDLDRRARRRT